MNRSLLRECARFRSEHELLFNPKESAAFAQRLLYRCRNVWKSLKLLRSDYLELPFIEMIVTTRCNLACAHCSNLIPYVPDKKDVTLSRYKQELEKLLAAVDYIYRFKIHGGEVFMHPDAAEIITHTAAQSKIGEVRLSTNGTILPDKGVVEAMKDPKVLLFVGSYGDSSHETGKILTEVLTRENIRFRLLENQRWADLGDCSDRGYDLRMLRYLRRNCMMANCKSYYGGKVYICSRVPNGVGAGVLPDADWGVEVTGAESKTDIKRLYLKKQHACCGYCNGVLMSNSFLPAGEQGL